jgi:DUF971 family protein
MAVQQKEFVPVDIHARNETKELVVKWADGHTSTIPVKRLRGYCPCAECQGHGGDAYRFVENKAAGIFEATPVGRYAINFKFSDGHATGIFRWDFLRQLDPSEEARWGPPENHRS